MALIDDFLTKKNGVSLVIGVGAAILAPVVIPAVIRIARPAIKAAVKSGIIAYERGREAAAELSEAAEDLVAEAKAEVIEEHFAAHQDDIEAASAQTNGSEGAS